MIPSGPRTVGHPHSSLVLADAGDEPVPVRSDRIESRLQIADLEGNVAQTQLVGHRHGRSGHVVGGDEARELQPPTVGRLQHRDLAARARDAAHGLHELALHRSGALDLETQPDEERGRRVDVRDGDADVIETLYVCHVIHPPVVIWSVRRWDGAGAGISTCSGPLLVVCQIVGLRSNRS